MRIIKRLLTLSLVITSLGYQAELLHSEKSLYRNIFVEQRGDRRCMVFGRLSKHPDYQSCFDVNSPEYLVFSYTKLVLAALTYQPEPKSMLILGLGGGTLPMTLERIYPEAQIDSVEIDTAVLKVAKDWFEYKESDKQKSYVRDGRVFVKQQLRKKQQYDIVILDAFNGDYIPEHMMTQEFLEEVRELLTDNGLVIANTFSNNDLYDHESVTYQKVYPALKYIHSNRSGNRILLAVKKPEVLSTERALSKDRKDYLEAIGVDFEDFSDRLKSKPDWKENVRPLTDQFAPANLLNRNSD